jgi:hypothetical protein
VFLWERGKCCGAAHMLFGSPTWIISHNDSAVLPKDEPKWAPYAESVIKAAPTQPVFIVITAGTEPPTSATATFTMVQRFTGALPVWEESNDSRPNQAFSYPYDFVVYRVTPKG